MGKQVIGSFFAVRLPCVFADSNACQDGIYGLRHYGKFKVMTLPVDGSADIIVFRET